MSTKRLSRRELLKSVGASAALLPFLPAQIAEAAPVRRLIVWWTPNGVFDPEFDPDGEGTTFKFRRILEPLEPLRRKLLVLKGLDFKTFFKENIPNNHGEPLSHSLCAIATQGGPKYLGGGPSIDQLVAQRLGRAGSFDGLNVAAGAYAPHSRVSYRGPGDAITAETDTKKTFDAMFKGLTGGAMVIDRLRASRKSSIDLVRAELNTLKKRLGAADQRKIDAHLEHLRAQEIRIDGLAQNASSGTCTPPSLDGITGESGYVSGGRKMAMNIFMAMKCDFARVATFVWGGPSSNEVMTWAGATARHHDLSHAATPKPGSTEYEQLTGVGRWQAEQFRNFLQLLDGVQESDGTTMLDSSVVMWTSEHKAAFGTHERRDVPFVLAGSAGGRFKTGRVLRYPGRAHNDLYVTLAQAMGFPDVKTFGDPEVNTGALALG